MEIEELKSYKELQTWALFPIGISFEDFEHDHTRDRT